MKTIDELRAYLIDTFSDEQIFLFGSRARGSASAYSDIDIAIKGRTSLGDKLSVAKFAIEESTLPQKVDLIDLSQAPWLNETIRREGVRWH